MENMIRVRVTQGFRVQGLGFATWGEDRVEGFGLQPKVGCFRA